MLMTLRAKESAYKLDAEVDVGPGCLKSKTKDGHAHGQAVGYLLQMAECAIGHIRRYFHAPIDQARLAGAGLALQPQPLLVHPEERRIRELKGTSRLAVVRTGSATC